MSVALSVLLTDHDLFHCFNKDDYEQKNVSLHALELQYLCFFFYVIYQLFYNLLVTYYYCYHYYFIYN